MSNILAKRRLRQISRFLLVIISFYLVLTATLYFLQESMIFRPVYLPKDYAYSFPHQFEELYFETEENASINALHFKAAAPRGVILYFHGNTGNLARWGEITGYFVDLNYDVLVMDYRGYGKSSGPLSERAFYKDAQFCYDYLLKLYPEAQITVYGRSLGSGMATKVAADNDPRRLILESPFYSIVDVAKKRFPILPVRQLLRYEFPNHKHMQRVKCPVTILHGTDDFVVPFSSGQKLYLDSRNGKTEFVPVEGGNHNDLINFEAYHQAIEHSLK